MEKKSNKIKLVIIIITLILVVAAGVYFAFTYNKNANSEVATETQSTQTETKEHLAQNEYALTDNNFSKFDLSFLKFENKKENKIYSPLSIKYAFKMLEEAATGNAKKQLADIVQAYNLTEYKSNKNMSLANAFFVKDTFKENVKEDYIELLKSKYNADVEFDSFKNAKNVNSWVKKNTLDIIPSLMEDSDVENLDFALINALAIDMDWHHKFLDFEAEDDRHITSDVMYNHAKMQGTEYGFSWMTFDNLYEVPFDEDQKVSSMEVFASINNYDVVSEVGEDNIREIVYKDFKEYVANNKEEQAEFFNNDFSDENVKKVFDKWFDSGLVPGMFEGGTGFIEGLNENLDRLDYSTDFSLYVDDDVKVFAKDLEESDGTTLQYIGIMPTKEKLADYIEKTDNEEILELVGNLKELKNSNFKEDYFTYIHGFIPKFTFEYELDLINDLQKMGVTDVFEEGKANLTNLTDNNEAYINNAIHKANIEFTQDGIKAAAATMAGGAGAGDWYDYFFEMPTEEIDITFDKPYMFLIRDKETGETWFVGTVYNPLDSSEETGDIIQYSDEV